MEAIELQPIGEVHSELKRRRDCPRQGREGAPSAWVVIAAAFVSGLEGISRGQGLVLLTWLHEAGRDVLQVHPRGDTAAPLRGVFLTRSPDRPNPVGLHRVEVLEVLDGTPIIDVKPVLAETADA